MIVYLYLDKHNPKSASIKSNGSLQGAQIHMLIKPVKHKIQKQMLMSFTLNWMLVDHLYWTVQEIKAPTTIYLTEQIQLTQAITTR